MSEIARLVLAVDSQQVGRADNSLDKLTRSSERAERQAGRHARATDQLGRSMRFLQGAAAAVATSLALREIVQAADEYTNLNSKIKLVTDSMGEQQRVYTDLLALAQETRSEFSGTVDLYTRVARSTKELNLSHEELLTIVKAVNQGFVVSGATAEEAAGAIRQLTQGIASGTLRGEELNSVMENAPRLAEALATAFGVTIGELRRLGQEGAITAEAISRALIEQAGSIEREFEQMPKTVGGALQQLKNQFVDTFGRTDVQPLVGAIDDLRELMADPSFQRNVVTLGTAIVRTFSVATEVLTEFVDLGEDIGRTAAQIAHGTDEIQNLQESIERLEELKGSSALSRAGIWNIDGKLDFYLDDSEIETALANAKAKLNAALMSQGLDPAYGADGTLATGKVRIEAEASAGSDESAASLIGGGGDDKAREKAAKRLEAVRESLMSETELINAEYMARREAVLEALDQKIIDEQEANAILYDAQRRHQQEMTALAEEEAEKRNRVAKWEALSRAEAASMMFTRLSGLMSSKYEALFRIGQVAALANIWVRAPEMAHDAAAWGMKVGGPPMAAAFKAASYVVSAAQAAEVASVSFGGGASGGGGAGGGFGPTGGVQTVPATPAPVQLDGGAAGGQTINITINGSIVGTDRAELADLLGEALRERIDTTDFVLVEPTSRNGRALAGRS